MVPVSADYDLNVGRFISEHPDWALSAGPGGAGYSAQRKNGHGHGAGEPVTALTLDELAARLEQEERTP